MGVARLNVSHNLNRNIMTTPFIDSLWYKGFEITIGFNSYTKNYKKLQAEYCFNFDV